MASVPKPPTPPAVTKFGTQNGAPAGRRCDVCFSHHSVYWIRIPLIIGTSAHDPEICQGSYWRLASLCSTCQSSDGGLVSFASRNGVLVYRLGSESPWQDRTVIVPNNTFVH